jgi:hypothetical protein
MPSSEPIIDFAMPALLDVADVQRLLGCGENVAYETMHKTGRAIRIGRRALRLRPVDLDAYLSQLAAEPNR